MREKRSRKMRQAKRQAINMRKGTNEKKSRTVKKASSKAVSSMSSHIMSLDASCFDWQHKQSSPSAQSSARQSHGHGKQENDRNVRRVARNGLDDVDFFDDDDQRSELEFRNNELDSLTLESANDSSIIVPLLKLPSAIRREGEPSRDNDLGVKHTSIGTSSLADLKLSTTKTFPHIGNRFDNRAAAQSELIDHISSFSQWQARLCSDGLLEASKLIELTPRTQDVPATNQRKRVHKKHVRWSSRVDQMEIERKLAALEQSSPLRLDNSPVERTNDSRQWQEGLECDNNADAVDETEDKRPSGKSRRPAGRIRKIPHRTGRPTKNRQTSVGRKAHKGVVKRKSSISASRVVKSKQIEEYVDDDDDYVYSSSEPSEDDGDNDEDERYEDDTFE
jgi:hypothetical protein